MTRRLPVLFAIVSLIGLIVVFAPRPVLMAQNSAGITTIVSISSSGAPGNDMSEWPAISADGRFVAFYSYASNLVNGDTNGFEDIFVHDRQTGSTSRVSISSDGDQANNWSDYPTLSADGRFVAFRSNASNLVAGDTNNAGEVFVHDRQTGSTNRVAVNSTGDQGNNSSDSPRLSADGRYVAFSSPASNLVSGDTNNVSDVFVHDRQTGVTTLVSVSSTGEKGNFWSDYPTLSADGRFVVFMSGSTNLVTGDSNGYVADVFVHDRQTGVTSRISESSAGDQGNGSSDGPTLSADGHFVAFQSAASNLVTGDTNGHRDIFIQDRQTGVISRVSVSSVGTQASGESWHPSISADGRFVAFVSQAVDLVTEDENGDFADVFIHDRQTGTTMLVSVSSTGEQGNCLSDTPTISADGRTVAFFSRADNLIIGDMNEAYDIFVHEREGIQPAAITDLRTQSGPAAAMANLFWTEPQGVTPSMRYRIRYRVGGPINSASSWAAATPVSTPTLPMAAGQTQTLTVRGLVPGQTYYFAARLEDTTGRLSPLSNSPATVVPAPERIDLTVSLWRAPDAADKTKYEQIFRHFADGVYEMSNGAHAIGTITIYQNKEDWHAANVQWGQSRWPSADASGYGQSSKHIYMGDEFAFDSGPYDVLSSDHFRAAGYALAHEWGHYYYGLYDEYKGKCTKSCSLSEPQDDDTPVPNSVMNSQWNAEGGHYEWLNFSIAKNVTGDTAQHRVFEASGWQTLARPPSQDPRGIWRLFLPKRHHYPELAVVAPRGAADSTIELNHTSTPAVTIVWDTSFAASLVSEAAYDAEVRLSAGLTVSYPAPILVAASVTGIDRITRAGVVATATTPGGDTLPLTLVDDGVAPDAIAEDGVYSGYLPYGQSGTYEVSVTFDNAANTAVYTQLATSWSIGPNGEIFVPTFEPVGEPFSATATATVVVSGVQPDDHEDTVAVATPLPVGNIDLTGRIDHAGDRDWFAVTPAEYGRLAVRVTNIGLGLSPRLRVLAADGTTVLADVTTPPVADLYLFAVIDGDPELPVYIEVSDTNATAAGGVYDVSAGTPLPPETAAVAGPPQIAGFSVPGAAIGEGILITGVDLVDVSAVAFNGVAATFTPVSDTELYAEVPAGASSGSVTVTTPHGTATSWMAFIVAPAPAVTGFAPASGLPGSSVTINGMNLSTVTAVAFNGETAVSFAAVSATQIAAVVPAGATTGKITVTTLGGVAESAGNFTVILPPTISGFSPTSGPVGTSVTITGSAFSGATAVTFNSVNAASFTVNSATQITSIVPTGATTGKVAVTTPGGTATSAADFTVTTAPNFPDVFYISPSANVTVGGIAAQGADVLRYTRSANSWTMLFDGSAHSLTKNISAFALTDDGSLLFVLAANQAIAGLGTVTPYDVVRFTPTAPGVFPLGAGTYSWFLQGRPKGLTTTAEKIDAIDLAGNRLLLSTFGLASVPKPGGGVLKPADEDVFAFNLSTNAWESTLVIDGSKMPGMGVEDINGVWDDPQSGDYYVTILGPFNLGGLAGNDKGIVKLTPNGGASVYTPSLVSWLAAGVTLPTGFKIDGIEIAR